MAKLSIMRHCNELGQKAYADDKPGSPILDENYRKVIDDPSIPNADKIAYSKAWLRGYDKQIKIHN